MLRLTQLEDRNTPDPLGFELVFSDNPWFTPQRKYTITQAFAKWSAVVADEYPPVPQTGYQVYDFHGTPIDTPPTPVPANTLRVWIVVGVPTSAPNAYAEASAGVSYSNSVGGELPRRPGGMVSFNPAVTKDADLPAIALHEAGHVVGLDHTPPSLPDAWSGVMSPYLNPTKTELTGIDYRNLVWSGHEVAPGTVLMGIGTTPGGWMVYNPHPR